MAYNQKNDVIFLNDRNDASVDETFNSCLNPQLFACPAS